MPVPRFDKQEFLFQYVYMQRIPTQIYSDGGDGTKWHKYKKNADMTTWNSS